MLLDRFAHLAESTGSRECPSVGDDGLSPGERLSSPREAGDLQLFAGDVDHRGKVYVAGTG